MEINRRLLVTLLVIGLFCFIPLTMSVCAVRAEESALLPKSTFLKAEIKDIRYDEVKGMVMSGSETTLKIVLTNISKEITESELSFYSELEGAIGSIGVDGLSAEAVQSGSSYTLKHKNVQEEVVISWSGEAPEVGKRDTFMLLNITQETDEGTYSVIVIERDVTSEVVEAAIDAFGTANNTIAKASETVANAEAAGLNVADAKTSLALAREHLSNAQQRYNEGQAEEALEEAELALTFAQEAEDKAESAVGGRTYRNYGILGVVIVVVLVALVWFIQKRQKKRGVY